MLRPVFQTHPFSQCTFAHRLDRIHRLGEKDPLLDVRRQQRHAEKLGHPDCVRLQPGFSGATMILRIMHVASSCCCPALSLLLLTACSSPLKSNEFVPATGGRGEPASATGGSRDGSAMGGGGAPQAGNDGGDDAGFALPPPILPQVSAGADNACAVEADGHLACWGNNSSGKSTPPAGVWRQVSCGDGTSCALRDDGTVACWGSEDLGRSSETFVRIGVGSGVACGIRSDGTLSCWGNTSWWPTGGPQGRFVQLNVQGQGGCALRTDGTAACWGDNYFFPSGVYSSLGAPYGIRPDGTLVAMRGDISFVLPTGTFVEICGESTGGCARRSNDTLACWGNNFTERLKPPSDTFAQVSLGFTLACGVRRDNQIVC